MSEPSVTPDETEMAFADALIAEWESGSKDDLAQFHTAIAQALAIQREAIVGSAVDVLQGLADLIESKVTVDVVKRDPQRALQTIVDAIRGAAGTFAQ